MQLLAIFIGVTALLVLAVWLYILRQGDAAFAFLVDSRSAFQLDEITHERAVFTCQIPFVNQGTQDGTLVDVFPRHLLPHEYFDAVKVDARVTIASLPRSDGYWEAVIIPQSQGDTVLLTVEFTAKNGDIRDALREMVDMPVDIVFQVVARAETYLAKARTTLLAGEVAAAIEKSVEKGGAD